MKSKRIVNTALINVIKRGSCVICRSPNPDAHHVKSKKSGGDDVINNLMPLCRVHHIEVHKIGLSRFSDKYDNAQAWLVSYEWEFSNLLMRWVKPKGGGAIV
jgi:hypothetical protein